MPLVSQSIPSFKGGVSQQPDILRFPDQVSELINGFPNEVDGLQKRPPTLHVARLCDTTPVANTKYHIINRDGNEQYILQLSSGDFKVWNLSGEAQPTAIEGDAGDYITTATPRDSLRAVTVADYTFILNTEKLVGSVTGTSPAGNSDTALIYIKNAQYAKSYAIFIDSIYVCGVITPDGAEAKQAVETTTSYIAQGLHNLLNGSQEPNMGDTYGDLIGRIGGSSSMGYSKSGYDFGTHFNVGIIGDSTLVIQRKDGADINNISVRDGFGNQNALVFSGKVSAINKLPPVAPNGYIMEVSGEKNSGEDNFFVKWEDRDKVWKETIAPSTPYHIEPINMPHAIVREADGTFRLKALSWVPREAGDEGTNPDPSFIGKTINDIFFYRNRLGMIADESVILSATNDFFNFWYKSATTIADTDPIDVSVSSNKVAILTHAVPFSRELMLFSREGQFVLSSDGVMTPKSVKCDQITNFVYNTQVQPISVGASIFFVNDRVNYTSVMRYYSLQDTAELKGADDITAHVPTYIPNGIMSLSGNTTESVIVATHRNLPNVLYCYKYILQGGESLQQAWFKWTYGDEYTEIGCAEFINSTLYLVVNTRAGLFLEKSNLIGNSLDFSDEPYRLFIDRKLEFTIPNDAEYNDFTDETTLGFSSFYGAGVPNPESNKYYIVTPEGYVHTIDTWDAQGHFKVKGDLRNTKVYIGRAVNFYTKLSQQAIRKQMPNGGVVVEDVGRLVLRYYWFNYSNSGVFKCCVNNNIKNNHYTYDFTGRLLGQSKNILGRLNLKTGLFKFPVQDTNTEVELSVQSDNPQPINIISGGWEGLYIKRSTGI